MGHMGEVWDVPTAALFLASDESKYVKGIELVVDGGITCKWGRLSPREGGDDNLTPAPLARQSSSPPACETRRSPMVSDSSAGRAPRGGDGAGAQRVGGKFAGRNAAVGIVSAAGSSARYSSLRIQLLPMDAIDLIERGG